MNELTKKRLIGVVVLVVVGVLIPLLLSRCMHSGSKDKDQGSMRVYNVQPDGNSKPADSNQNAGQDNGGSPGQQNAQGGTSGNGEAANDQSRPTPDAVSPNSQSDFSTPPVHGNSAQSGQNRGKPSHAQPEPKPKPSRSSHTESTSKPDKSSSASSSAHDSASSNRSGSGSSDYGSSSMGSQSSSHSSSASKSSGSSSGSGLEQSSISGWVVQVASFSHRNYAESMAKKLKGQFKASYTPGQANGKTLYRVNVGPFDSRDAAESAADRLSQGGHKGLVRHLP